MKNGIAKCVTATDIREGPLLRAKSAALIAEETGISFLRSDGLKDLSAEDYDTVIIAGMGGETIIKIIDESGWNWSDGHRIILQPMTKIPELIVLSVSNGFSILDEKLAQDKNERYRILLIEKAQKREERKSPGPFTCISAKR
jgi:tRNA (adenine22-N1)-methyltransferase